MSYDFTISLQDWRLKKAAKDNRDIHICYGYLKSGEKAIFVFGHSSKPLPNGDVAVAFVNRLNNQQRMCSWSELPMLVSKVFLKRHPDISLVNKHGRPYKVFFHGCGDGYKKPVSYEGLTIMPLTDYKETTYTTVVNTYQGRIHHVDGSVTEETLVDIKCEREGIDY